MACRPFCNVLQYLRPAQLVSSQVCFHLNHFNCDKKCVFHLCSSLLFYILKINRCTHERPFNPLIFIIIHNFFDLYKFMQDSLGLGCKLTYLKDEAEHCANCLAVHFSLSAAWQSCTLPAHTSSTRSGLNIFNIPIWMLSYAIKL